jgi:hypothetical protein
MLENRKFRVRFAAVVLLSLLVAATVLGGAWHHHSGGFDANCCFCHLSHQPLEPALAVDSEPLLVFSEFQQETPVALFLSGPVARRLPARAPPAL